MSHFITLVILPKFVQDDKIHDRLTKVMARYREDRRVPPYYERCSCIGLWAELAGSIEANRQVEDIEILRQEHWNSPSALRRIELMCRATLTAEETLELRETSRSLRVEWERISAPWEAFKAEFLQTHPRFNMPDPECEYCHGRGVHRTTRNPVGKWDWYRIGGRWDGFLYPDQGNWMQESRQALGLPPMEESLVDPFRFGPQYETISNNSRDIESLPHPILDELRPYAIVDPMGEWHENKSEGDTVRSELEWDNRFREILETYRNGYHRVINLDCHT